MRDPEPLLAEDEGGAGAVLRERGFQLPPPLRLRVAQAFYDRVEEPEGAGSAAPGATAQVHGVVLSLLLAGLRH